MMQGRGARHAHGGLAAVGMAAAVGLAAGNAAAVPAAASQRIAKDGVVVQFSATPVTPGQSLTEGGLAEVRFRITDESTGRPVQGAMPGAWMDLAEIIRARGEGGHIRSCRDKIALYLKGVVGIRPLVDLNSYSMLVLNKDASVTVIDPNVSMAGSTSTLAQVRLKEPGIDWVQDGGRKALHISMPAAGQIAVLDTETFKIRAEVDAGPQPTRVVLQPDGRVVWVGNNGKGDGSGVTAIDADSLRPLGSVSTGAGHHEIAASADSRRLFVTNREAGTVSVVDTVARRKIQDVPTGPMPISIAWSAQSQSVYVGDGKDGSVAVLDGRTGALRKRVALAPGLGPMRFMPDGRHAMVLNPSAQKAYVIDASSDELVNTIDLPGQPYQLAATRGFAYVRLLDSERVAMINLGTLGRGQTPRLQSFPAGAAAPKFAGDLVLADGMTPASAEAAMFVVSPADNTTYFYMEGMNAPSSNYLARGYQARAITVVDRSLKEVEPGVYAARARLPASGRFDVAFQLDSPRLLHCFAAEVEADPKRTASSRTAAVEFLLEDRNRQSGETLPLRFRLVDPATGAPRLGVRDANLVYYLAPGRQRTLAAAREVGDGIYEADVTLSEPGAWYVHVRAPSLSAQPHHLPYLTLRASAAHQARAPSNPIR